MRFVDFEFVKRLEMAVAVSGQACGESMLKRHPEFPSAIEKIAGGIAVFTGADSPITQAIGVGLDGPVGEAELDRLGEFFRSRGAPAALEMCPFIDAALIESLGKRGYVVAEFSNVLFREPADVTKFSSAAEDVIVRPAKPEESKLYTETISKGYAEDLAISQELLDVVEGFCHDPRGQCFLAFIGDDLAGGGAATIHDGIGGLGGASVLPAFRRRGVQTALIRARLQWLAGRNCDWFMTVTHPGTVSQRNMERFGFRMAYTRAKLIRNWD